MADKRFVVTDSADCMVELDDVAIKACDVTEDGNVRNIDIIVDGELHTCTNIQLDSRESEIAAIMFWALMQLKSQLDAANIIICRCYVRGA